MLHVPNPDLMRALARIPPEGSAEARMARHRRCHAKARRAGRRARFGRILRALRALARRLAGAAGAGGRPPATARITCPEAVAGTA